MKHVLKKISSVFSKGEASTAFAPKISIIIPVYNGADYLAQAIDSALAQTYKNREIIVVNDGSSDSGATEDVALSYGEKIHYITKENGGVASALNVGIQHMQGDYFSWLSHDDLYVESKLESQVKFLSGMKNKKVILYGNYDLIDADGGLIHAVKMNHDLITANRFYPVLRGAINGCSMLIPKECFVTHGLFDESLKTTQDYDLWFKMLRTEKFIHMPAVLMKSRFHDEQDSKKNPYALREANALWKMFCDDLTESEMLECETSVEAFYQGMVTFLKETPYTEAYEHAKAKLSACLKEGRL